MIPFDDTGATLTTDVLAAWPTGNPAGPDAEKRAVPRFFCFPRKPLAGSTFVSAGLLLLDLWLFQQ